MMRTVEKLKSKSLKITPQRLAIYQMLCDSDKHPSAEIIHKNLESSHPSMSLATVYKTLDTLTKAELLLELHVGESRSRYDANTEAHPHLVCEECHEVFDLPLIKNIAELRDEIMRSTPHLIHSEQICFYGLCQDCRRQSQSKQG